PPMLLPETVTVPLVAEPPEELPLVVALPERVMAPAPPPRLSVPPVTLYVVPPWVWSVPPLTVTAPELELRLLVFTVTEPLPEEEIWPPVTVSWPALVLRVPLVMVFRPLWPLPLMDTEEPDVVVPEPVTLAAPPVLLTETVPVLPTI